MSIPIRVTALKEQFAQIFSENRPGKKQQPTKNQQVGKNLQTGKILQTGIAEIDNSKIRGIARKCITEWIGNISSEKTNLLKSAISNWHSSGLKVAYIDTENKLEAEDWTFADSKGKFWIIRRSESETKIALQDGDPLPLISTKNLYVQEAIWSADQFIRSNAFDVVILDLGSFNLRKRRPQGIGYCPKLKRIYARLQRALNNSKTALIIVSDTPDADNETTEKEIAYTVQNNFGCYSSFIFDRPTATRAENSEKSSIAMIVPTANFQIWSHGKSQKLAVRLSKPLSNQLLKQPVISIQSKSTASNR
ncbi:MAG: hypothetical protein K2W82_01600 [Candidatus Obscuribacterales bacterium]|jgi:RecA/RadA recombinase|nr:hypothetical protein [Candidatus Obscuribacterales bacterium]